MSWSATMTRYALRFATALTAAVSVAATAIACASPRGGLSAAQAEELLRAHNGWRRMVDVRPLRWSDELARGAQAHADSLAADGCRLSHHGLPANVGENLLASVFSSQVRDEAVHPMAPAEVVNLWASEGSDYDDSRNACASGKQCTHYTQLVAQRTKEVGCGMALCPSRGQVWVCDYYPAGNIEGKRPY
jgi:pathogenesis-related protein 1